MNRRLLLTFLIFTVGGLLHAADAKISVLLIDGYGNHDWQLTTRVIRAVLDKTGKFEVAVSTVPTTASAQKIEDWKPDFKAYDVVMQTVNDLGRRGPRWPRDVEQAFEDYVRGGGGLYIFHSANNAFEGWPEYNRMIGLGWRKKEFGPAIVIEESGEIRRIPAGEGSNTGHGPRIDALLTRVGDHPIHAGLPRQFKAADLEVYGYARGPAENLTVLSYARDPRNELNFPIEWVVQYGEGRVYNSTFGHVWARDGIQNSVKCAAFQTLMPRALEWLAKREVDGAAPADFPTAEDVSLRESPLADEIK